MGVHVSFVRSVDLDEWTQRQIDAMRIGGNDNAKKFFRKHGCTDFHTKTVKKYTSKAAVAYRAELEKLVNAEAAKRGEGSGTVSSEEGAPSSLLENADAIMKKGLDEEARSKLEAARANGGVTSSSAGVLQPTAKLASSFAGAKGKLNTPTVTPTPTPPASGGLSANGLLAKTTATSSGGSKLVLRKPSASSASSKLLRKTSSMSTGSKLRVNKISSSAASSTVGSEDDFEDVAATQKAIEEQNQREEEEKKRQQEEDAKLAQKLQMELNGLGEANQNVNGDGSVVEKAIPPTPSSTPASELVFNPTKPKMSAMEENMAKLSAMNSDFFSGM